MAWVHFLVFHAISITLIIQISTLISRWCIVRELYVWFVVLILLHIWHLASTIRNFTINVHTFCFYSVLIFSGLYYSYSLLWFTYHIIFEIHLYADICWIYFLILSFTCSILLFFSHLPFLSLIIHDYFCYLHMNNINSHFFIPDIHFFHINLLLFIIFC